MLNQIKMVTKSEKEEKLDEEWIELMQAAYKMGIPIEEIRRFITYNKHS
ncbi:anti-repressor SinI family protein [Priestia aryabhattai]